MAKFLENVLRRLLVDLVGGSAGGACRPLPGPVFLTLGADFVFHRRSEDFQVVRHWS